MTKRATAAEFQAWKEACIADPSKLTGSKEYRESMMRIFGIGEPVAPTARVVSANSPDGTRLKLHLHDDATLAEIAEFTQHILPLMPAIPTDQFHLLLRKAQAAMARIDATWEDVFAHMKEVAA